MLSKETNKLFKLNIKCCIMIKRICFFSGGFAFNRLLRMKYYEKIFPKNIKMFLFTTNKHDTKKNYKSIDKWDLNRTKIEISDYNIFKTTFFLRKFCRKNKIDRLVNLGAPGAGILFLIATLFQKTDYLIGYYGEVVKHKNAKGIYEKVRKFFLLFQYILVAQFAKKLAFTERRSYKQAPILFFFNKDRVEYLHAPVNTELFNKSDKIISRNKLNVPLDKKVIIRVGRINYGKCGDILIKLIENNQNIYFILIGEWFGKKVRKIKSKNLLYIESKSSKNLVDFYNASDLSFCLHRHGDSMGIVAEESLACGVPVLLPEILLDQDSKAIIKTSYSLSDINKKINHFFSLSKEERERISDQAREYAEKYCSDDVWSEKYIKFHLT